MRVSLRAITLILVLLAAAATAIADPLTPTTPVTLTGVGDGSTVGSVYVDPYTATVGGVSNTSVICDDWSDNSYINESWTANVTNVATAGTSGTPLFGNNQTLYNELAWLATQLLANPTNPTRQAEVSFAMWELTYGANGTSTESPSPSTYLSEYGTAAEQSAVATLLSEAASEGGFNSSGWEILTPNTSDPITCSGGPCPSTPPQEFLVYVPEPPAPVLLGAGLATLIFLFRRRMVRTEN